MLLQILYILIPTLLIGGTFFLLAWVGKRLLIDRKRGSSASQLLAQQTLYDLKTDEGRQAMVELTEMGERQVQDDSGAKDNI